MVQILNWYDRSAVEFPIVAGEHVVELGPHTSLTYPVQVICGGPEKRDQLVFRIFTPLQGTFVGFIALVEAALIVLREKRPSPCEPQEVGGVWWKFELPWHGPVKNFEDIVSMCRVTLEVHRDELVHDANTKFPKFSPALQFR
ncbi:uncharacterized protein LDX57_012063 [Aspergillus melleus]|uniref:uncharacterized protein n=1 Tax=Aspergillus melleus TaxID=138277 RepID=UPI001E8E32FA|nr:uncharacterized protein LDX57_012063 [Aspergillus melleus]KAH8434416.1 hypothetical protein LDX57_012063 [Aspergillus melleus]